MADHGPSEGCWITETEVSSQEPGKQLRKNNWGKDDAHPIFVVSVIKRLGFIYLIHPYSLLKSCLLIYSEFEHTLLYIYHIHIQMIGTQVLANNLWGLHHLLIYKYRNKDRVWLSTCRCSGNIQSYRTKSNRKHLPKRRMNPKTRTDNSDEVSISKAIMVFFPWNDWRCTQNTGVVV